VDELDTYARAAARLGRLEIDEAWWPGVLRHLAVLCDNARLVEAVDIAVPPEVVPAGVVPEVVRAGVVPGVIPGVVPVEVDATEAGS
jgi:hypothetical protein